MKQNELEKKKIELFGGIAQGEKAILKGRIYTQEEAKKKMSQWLIKKNN